MKSKIIALIVIYNKNITDSNAFNTLVNLNGIDILIADNSTINTNNQHYAQEHHLNYISNNGNLGLSKTYNKITKLLLDNSTYPYILLCDDDTSISQAYIDELNNIINTKHPDLIIPQIINTANQQLYSPRTYDKTPLITKIYQPNQKFKYIKAINSGLCINLNIFKEFSYNENNFLYFVDVNFFEDYVNKNDLEIVVSNQTLNQELSQFDTQLTASNLAQMKLRLKDSKAYNSLPTHLLYKNAFIMQMLLHYKDIKILSLYFN